MLTFWQSFILAFTALLPLINPLGSALVFLGLVGEASPATYQLLARRIAINTVIFLATIELLGSTILTFFGVSLPVVQLAGGLVVAAIGWGLLNQKDASSLSEEQSTAARARVQSTRASAAAEVAPASTAAPQPEFQSLALKAFYPFTFPITAGPGTIVVMLTLSAHASSRVVTNTVLAHLGIFAAAILLCGLVYLCYAYAPTLTRFIAPTTAHGILRVIAFILLCIGAQIAWNGTASLINTLRATPIAAPATT